MKTTTTLQNTRVQCRSITLSLGLMLGYILSNYSCNNFTCVRMYTFMYVLLYLPIRTLELREAMKEPTAVFLSDTVPTHLIDSGI
jgi:hypothetical protein